MNTLIFSKDKIELIITPINSFIKSDLLPKKPTVCLIVLDKNFEKEEMIKMVNTAIDAGAIFFMTFGDFAEELHDFIDEIIEFSQNNLTHIVTTFHKSEQIADIAKFFIYSTYFENNDCRYMMLFDTDSFTVCALQKELLLIL
ncbi:MAG: hypothetical protein LBL65_06990 [Campylobacteraceae bacterium]|jgi:hypothetical protein|nr:hypothetical protein [Campylobacteraceae bacterium]